MLWITDDAGDLINLEHVESIMIMKIDHTQQDAPKDHTHELLAINPAQESYRLTSGAEEAVKQIRGNIITHLIENKQYVFK